MKAVKCPVCDGLGKVKDPNYNPGATGEQQDVKCHGCDGKGWVEVQEDCYPFTPVNPYPYEPWIYPREPYAWRWKSWQGVEPYRDYPLITYTYSH